MNVVLLGYYGFENLGDDLMMEGAANALANHPWVSRVVVFRASGRAPASSRSGVRFADVSGKTGKIRLLLEIARADRVIWGGGTCIYEPDDRDLSGLRFLAFVARACRTLGRPLALCGVGIGRLSSAAATAVAQAILEDAGWLSFRDAGSARLAEELGADPGRIRLGGDLFFLSVPVRSLARERHVLRTVSFSGVHHYAGDTGIVDRYAQILRGWLSEPELEIVFLPLHRGSRSDEAFHGALARHLPVGRYRFAQAGDPLAGAEALGQADVHVGMRLHSIALADCLGVPNLGLEYSPKVARYVEKSSMGEYRRLFAIGEEVTVEHLRHALCRFVQNVAFLRSEREAARVGLLGALD